MFGLPWSDNRSSNSNSRYSGYLYKLKRKQKLSISQWNKRWFSIEGTLFKWYQYKESNSASGSLDLSQVTAIEEFETGSGGSFR